MVAFDIGLKKQDEWYTPCYAVLPIVRYLRPASHIWCPFDTDDSNFVRVLKDRGFRVTNTHLAMGVDFFKAEPPEGCDYIVSNPPYSLKTEVLKRLYQFQIPFAMLCGNLGLLENQRFHIIRDGGGCELMVFDKRISYFTDYRQRFNSTGKQPPFASWYICHKVLPQQIVFETLHRPKVDGVKKTEQEELELV